ncbi:phage regulatory CII family protein [Bordetella bronchiseptica]|uniref:phage regulatory CII family protein n=1 Tax=Bordetella bronchiseptica TaxID=518 RepID=UPI0004620000|nr:phage regulatory CII family protein [Bordetella bronchiseptica]KDD10130.1 phage regulatory protein CII [Bordetella bronchiseptica MBORD707]QET71420.1 hypothetical protein FOB42_14345 [Bordetella bronchiseptica]
MTCRYSQIDPHDALYNSVRRAPGGVDDLAQFLAARRGVTISPQTLRQKMRREKRQAMSLELFELTTEWMLEKAGGDEYARDWIIALAIRHGVAASVLPPPLQHDDEARAARDKVMEMSALNGQLSAVAVEALSDGEISEQDASAIVAECDKIIQKAQRLKRNVVRGAGVPSTESYQ